MHRIILPLLFLSTSCASPSVIPSDYLATEEAEPPNCSTVVRDSECTPYQTFVRSYRVQSGDWDTSNMMAYVRRTSREMESFVDSRANIMLKLNLGGTGFMTCIKGTRCYEDLVGASETHEDDPLGCRIFGSLFDGFFCPRNASSFTEDEELAGHAWERTLTVLSCCSTETGPTSAPDDVSLATIRKSITNGRSTNDDYTALFLLHFTCPRTATLLMESPWDAVDGNAMRMFYARDLRQPFSWVSWLLVPEWMLVQYYWDFLDTDKFTASALIFVSLTYAASNLLVYYAALKILLTKREELRIPPIAFLSWYIRSCIKATIYNCVWPALFRFSAGFLFDFIREDPVYHLHMALQVYFATINLIYFMAWAFMKSSFPPWRALIFRDFSVWGGPVSWWSIEEPPLPKL